MYKKQIITVIIAAAGLGTRMGSGIPKQYRQIGGKPMLLVVAELFLSHPDIDHVIAVTNEEYAETCRTMFCEKGLRVDVVPGGATRQDSVYEGLKRLPQDTELVLIHDAARPYTAPEVIDQVIQTAYDTGAAVCAVPVKDTIRMLSGQGSRTASTTLDRGLLYAVQTPQGFQTEIVLQAYKKAFAEGFYGTDDAMLVERAGIPVALVEGAYENYKITTKGDLSETMEVKSGIGYDVHAFAEGRDLVLGGVAIPHEKGLLGHSDADVLTHAIMDALLGAAGEGDIGRHFPDSDEQYRGASSLLLLQEVAQLIEGKGYEIGNIDATIIAEKPRISPRIPEMLSALSKSLGIPESKINIKGTTTEGLGFTGRREGIAACATSILYKKGEPR